MNSTEGMFYASEKPTEFGWYWYRNPAHGHDADKDAEIVEVDPFEDTVYFVGNEDPYRLSLTIGEFAGPIPRPIRER